MLFVGWGSIPASAGEPNDSITGASSSAVYPRECGGTFIAGVNAVYQVGLSPRVRGTITYGKHQEGKEGLSPRVRGNHATPDKGQRSEGSIPASAGEPGKLAKVCATSAVYPRECGGTVMTRGVNATVSGLSPRVRGNPFSSFPASLEEWSIPASAGEPQHPARRTNIFPVYPRECGGTGDKNRANLVYDGLSPRVRGNHGVELFFLDGLGSIPASAGEPHCRGPCTSGPGGLSPRVRGNLVILRVAPVVTGSIPASAGEPLSSPCSPRRGPVYPRECGGTEDMTGIAPDTTGLSPRVRGNPTGEVAVWAGRRSIPASAGEPETNDGPIQCKRVYPRECGGTALSGVG